jgi:sec-independent protein translocase protein TatB
MFDVGFQELALIFGVSLMVLGPKRLSGLVTKVGRWVGKARTMARDFRQQLEHEVNLEELNKFTEAQSRAARASPMSAPQPESTAEPQPESTTTYPYSAPAVPQTDDTFSHAHAEGESPMPYTPEQESLSGTATGGEASAGGMEQGPHQGDLDLSTPDDPPPQEDDSHLPPDDARRHS